MTDQARATFRHRQRNKSSISCKKLLVKSFASKKALADIQAVKSIILKITQQLEQSNMIAKDDILDIRCLLNGDEPAPIVQNECSEAAKGSSKTEKVQDINNKDGNKEEEIMFQTFDNELPSMEGKEREVFFTIISRKLEMKEQGFVPAKTRDLPEETDDSSSLVVVETSISKLSTIQDEKNEVVESFFSSISEQLHNNELSARRSAAHEAEEESYAITTTTTTGIPLRNVRPYRPPYMPQVDYIRGCGTDSLLLASSSSKGNIGTMLLNLFFFVGRGGIDTNNNDHKSESWAGVPLLNLAPYQDEMPVVRKTEFIKPRNVHDKNYHSSKQQQQALLGMNLFKVLTGYNKKPLEDTVRESIIGEDETEVTLDDSSSHSDYFQPDGAYQITESHSMYGDMYEIDLTT